MIENRSGSGGNIGAEAVAKAEPDGYTLGLIQLGNVAINPYVYTDMTFDPLTDLVPVAPVTSSAILVVANAKVPANDLRELIALAKREPGKLSYGSAGNGTAPHLAGEMFKAAAGVDILHVPYRGVGPGGERHRSAAMSSSPSSAGARCAARSMPASPKSWRWRNRSGSRPRRNIRPRPRPGCRATNSSPGSASSRRRARRRR